MVETVIIGLIVAGSIPALYLVEPGGRRPIAVIPLGIMIVPLAGGQLWAGGPLWFIVAMFFVYAVVFGGPSILVWICANELFPTEFRATVGGIATSVSRFGAATGTHLLPPSMSALGTGTTMLFGAILAAVAFVICILMAPETKGNSLEEVSSVASPAPATGTPAAAR